MTPRRALLLLLALLGVPFAREVTAATQTLTFNLAPAWYFVSVQVDPDDPRPDEVFPTDLSGFTYDHIWGYDTVDGWRHFGPGMPAGSTEDIVLNDLEEIVPLRGYWIHVTGVPGGGAQIPVTGPLAKIQRLEGASWHAAGPLLSTVLPADNRANVNSVFADLGPALQTRISQIWRYSTSGNLFAQIPLAVFGADCTSAPNDCLAQGQAYWINTTGSVEIGKQLELSADCVVLTPDQPFARLDVTYNGIGAAVGRIEQSSGSGLVLLGARAEQVDGSTLVKLDPAGSRADGPDACPTACGSADDCADLCFSAATGDAHSLFVGIRADVFGSVQQFTNCDDDAAYGAFDVLLGTDVVGTVRVALRPPVLRGTYAGELLFDEGGVGQIPIRMRFDDCVLQGPTTSYPENCQPSNGRITAIVNPTEVGSTGNAIDDDGDGDIDEPDEAGKSIPQRESPGFDLTTPFYGTTSGNQQSIRLRASDTMPDLDFATGEDGGVASTFRTATRELVLEGVRVGPATFVGTFVDGYSGTSLVGETLAAFGRFSLTRVEAPHCVLKNFNATEPLALEILCREDADCPGYCDGPDDRVDGFSCSSNADCALSVAGPSGPANLTGTCNRYECAFRDVAPSSEALLRRAAATVTANVQGTPQNVLLELVGPETLTGLTALVGASRQLSIPDLACGTYQIRPASPGCTISGSSTFNPCSQAAPTITVNCAGTVVTGNCMPAPGDVCSAALVNGSIALLSGVVGTALDATAYPEYPSLAAGAIRVIAAGGQHTVAAAPLGGWTDLIVWGATRLRAGVLAMIGV